MTEDVAAVLAGSKPWAVACGDALSVLQQMPAESVHCCVTSPPYFNLRAYGDGNAAELGREPVPDCLGWATGQKCGSCYVCRMVAVGEAVKRVLRDDGTFWLNLADCYSRGNGSTDGQESAGRKQKTNHGTMVEARSGKIPEGFKDKDLLGIPWRVALALQASGWYLRADCIWTKLSAMPSSVQGWRWERCRTKKPGTGWGDKVPHPSKQYDGKTMRRDNSGGVPKNGVAEWIDCPGCSKCIPNNGFVLRRGSWRPTTAHEYIFMFAKSERYYADGYAVRQRLAEATIMRDRYTRVLDDPDEQYAVAHDHETVSDPDIGANLRSWLVFKSEQFKGKHYAVFPPELPSLAIKCGTSEKGVCPHCGAPWARMVKTKQMVHKPSGEYRNGLRESLNDTPSSRTCVSGTMTEPPSAETLGWRQTCKCPEHEPIPAVILDPFSGAGTSVLAARRLHRRGIGIELYPQNVSMSRKRIAADLPLFNAVSTEDAE